MAVCFTGPPLRRWRSRRPAFSLHCETPAGGDYEPCCTSLARACSGSPASPAAPAAPSTFALCVFVPFCPIFDLRICVRRGPIANVEIWWCCWLVLAGHRGFIWQADGQPSNPRSDRAQRLGGTCKPGPDNTALTRPPRPCKGDTICTVSCGISPRVAVFDGIGQVMQRRLQSKSRNGLPAQYGLLNAVQDRF